MKTKTYNLPFITGRSGFTLLELLLSVAVLVIIAAFLVPTSYSVEQRGDLDKSAQTIVLALREAQLRAAGGREDDEWGIHLEAGSVIMFRGENYGTYPEDDAEQTFASTILPSGTTDIFFAKLTGLPDAAGEITLTGPSGETRTIEINDKGGILY